MEAPPLPSSAAAAAAMVPSAAAAEARRSGKASGPLGASAGVPQGPTSALISSPEELNATSEALAAPRPCRPGEFDDLNSFFMNWPAEIMGRRRSLSIGTGSRASGAYSRSLSPEDVPRAVVEAMAAAEAAAPGLLAGGASGVGTAGYPRASSKGILPSLEAEGEICMFGMSDDEQELPSDGEDDQLERNVVASTIQEGSGAAFATNVCFEPADLDLGLPASDGALSPLSTGASPRMLSPLMAQLNPFMPLPLLNLPPAVGAVEGMSIATWGTEKDAASAVATMPAEPVGAAPESGAAAGRVDVQHLLAEMGDLVCNLQQEHEMAITTQEVSSDELLERLLHFREVADNTELQCRP